MNSWCVQNKTTVLYSAMTQDLMLVIEVMCFVQEGEEIALY